MSIILDVSVTGMDQISINSILAQYACGIAYTIKWVKKVTTGKSDHCTIHRRLPLELRRGWLEVRREARQWAWIRSHRWRIGREVVSASETCWILAWKSTEIGSLVHINPKAINVDSIIGAEEDIKLIVPPSLRTVVKPIRKGSGSRPYDSYPQPVSYHPLLNGRRGRALEDRAIRVFHEYAGCLSAIESSIV